MPLISGTIPSLINGVSQQPATLRLPTQGEIQENGLSHIARGLEKRPCTEHITEVAGITSANSNDVFIHTIRRSEDEAYAVIIKGGTSSTNTEVKLIDLTGYATGTAGKEVYILDKEQEASYPSGQGTTSSDGITSSVPMSSNTIPNTYFKNFNSTDNIFSPNSLSSTTIADYSFILNKTQKVKQDSSSLPPTRPYESLLYYKVGDFGAKYQAVITEWNVGIDGTRLSDDLLNSDLPIDHSSYNASHTDPSNASHIYRRAVRNRYKIVYATPDNETESRSGGGNVGNSASINNQASVRVNTIANAINKGVDSSDQVYLIKDNQTTNYRVYVSKTNTDNSAEYADDKGVKSKGVVTGSTISTSSDSTNDASWAGGSGKGLTTASGGLISSNSRFKVIHDENTSVIHIKNTTYPISVELTDGKGDTYSRAVNGSDEVPNFGYLPGSANIETGFVAKISGDKAAGQDDYYVNWTGSVWKEVVQPMYPGGLAITGNTDFTPPYNLNTTSSSATYDAAYILNTLKVSRYVTIDKSTMPMQLYKAFGKVDGNANSVYFVLKPVPWADRDAGDQKTNPFPSFANYDPVGSPDGVFTVNDIFFHRNRLGFISDENVILSESGGYYNFFHTTVLSVLDTAVIDVAVSNNQVAILKSAIPFQESLILFSDLQQFKLTSDAFLTPTSVTVDVATNFETSTEAKPVPAGKTIFFPFQRGAFSGIREYFINISSETNDANEISAHVPEFVEGTVKKMAVSSNEEVLLILSETDRRQLKVYKYYYNDKEKMQSAWSTWKFDAEIIDMAFIGSVAFFLFRRGTTIYLEKLNLSVDNATSIMDDKIGVRLDRRYRLTAVTYTLKDYTPTPSAAWEASRTHSGTGHTSTQTSGTGSGMTFNITTDSNGKPTFVIASQGTGYNIGDTITITDPGSTSNTAIVHPYLLPYGDSNYDELTSTQVKVDASIVAGFGPLIKIKNLDKGYLPRVDQTFTTTLNEGVTYKITGVAVDPADATKAEIRITPSIAKDSPWPTDTVLTFEPREPIYVVETGEQVKASAVVGIMKNGSTFSKSKGNTTPDVFAGIPYDFKYQFSEQFVKNNDNSISSGRLQMRNFEISYAKSGNFYVEVAPRPYDELYRKINTKAFTAKTVGSLIQGQLQLETGVLRVPVYCNSKDARITVNSKEWHPIALQSADWEALQVLRSQRI